MAFLFDVSLVCFAFFFLQIPVSFSLKLEDLEMPQGRTGLKGQEGRACSKLRSRPDQTFPPSGSPDNCFLAQSWTVLADSRVVRNDSANRQRWGPSSSLMCIRVISQVREEMSGASVSGLMMKPKTKDLSWEIWMKLDHRPLASPCNLSSCAVLFLFCAGRCLALVSDTSTACIQLFLLWPSHSMEWESRSTSEDILPSWSCKWQLKPFLGDP